MKEVTLDLVARDLGFSRRGQEAFEALGPMEKRAFLQDLYKHWQALPTHHKWIVGIGGVLALLGLVQSLRSLGHLWGPLLGLGGAAAGLYGMAGGKLGNILNVFKSLNQPEPQPAPAPVPVGNTGSSYVPTQAQAPALTTTSATPSSPAGGLSLVQAAGHPSLSRFFNTDQSPRMADIMKASDDELRGGLKLLHPSAVSQLREQVTGFKPSWGQAVGARAMGIDIDAQRQRMLGLLGPGVHKAAAQEEQQEPGLAGTAGRLAAGTGLLGAAGHVARSGYGLVTPSFLQMAEQMMSEPGVRDQIIQAMRSANQKTIRRYARNPEVQERFAKNVESVTDLIKRQPGVLREILLDQEVPGTTRGMRNFIRRSVLQSAHLAKQQAGDIFIQSENPKITEMLTGGPFSHANVAAGPRTILDRGGALEHDPLGKSPVVRTRLPGMMDLARKNRWGFVRLAPRKAPAIRSVRGPGETIYDHQKLLDLAMSDFLPETQLSSGKNLLTGPLRWMLNRPTLRKLLKKKLPAEAWQDLDHLTRYSHYCHPGEVCSTLAGNVLEQTHPGLLRPGEAQKLTPNALARMTAGRDPRFRVTGMYLKPQDMAAEALKAQHRRRWAPLAMRAPVVAGLGGLGALGLYSGARRLMGPTPAEPGMAELAAGLPATDQAAGDLSRMARSSGFGQTT